MTRLELALISVLFFIFTIGVCTFAGHHYGKKQGIAEMQAKWDEFNRKAEEKEKGNRLTGYEKAEKLESELSALKGQYDAAIKDRQKALRKKFSCPKSGEIGDVVIPVDTVRSMFNIPADTDIKPGTTTTESFTEM